MVKGLSRKVIIVKSPDSKIFEQAIFIVKDDYMMTQGADRKELMRQANEAASGYIDRVYDHKHVKLKRAFLVSASVIITLALTAVVYFTLR